MSKLELEQKLIEELELWENRYDQWERKNPNNSAKKEIFYKKINKKLVPKKESQIFNFKEKIKHFFNES
jgi:hypothetical protein